MKAYLVALDTARARLFYWAGAGDPSLDGPPRLTELEDLTHPEARLHDREVFSNEIGNNRTTGPGPAHAFDDHREAHRSEGVRRFAREVGRRLSDLVSRDAPSRVILISETQMLHDLRQEVEAALPRGISVTELAENLSKLGAAELQLVLAKKGLLPGPHKGPTVDQFVPRGQPMPGSDVKRSR
jgi:protein required for attachment to host cells